MYFLNTTPLEHDIMVRSSNGNKWRYSLLMLAKAKENRFYLDQSAALYKKIMTGFICFALFFVYLHLGVSPLSIFLTIFFLLFGSILLLPSLNKERPLYIISEEGIKQNKVFFLQRLLKWADVKSILYPSSSLMGGKDTVILNIRSGTFPIGLSDVDQPFELLKCLNRYKPFDLNEEKLKIYFEHSFDREKMFYIILLYIVISVAALLMATFDMPYVWTEDNKYSHFWAALFFVHFFFSVFVAFSAYKEFNKRNSFVKSAIGIWLFVFLAPFLLESNAYYNVRAMKALEANDYATAEEYIKKAIELHPAGYSYYETYGKALFGLGKYDESVNTFKYLLEKDPRLTDYYIAYYNLWIGKSLLRMNRQEEAKRVLGKARELKIEKLTREIDNLLKDGM